MLFALCFTFISLALFYTLGRYAYKFSLIRDLSGHEIYSEVGRVGSRVAGIIQTCDLVSNCPSSGYCKIKGRLDEGFATYNFCEPALGRRPPTVGTLEARFQKSRTQKMLANASNKLIMRIRTNRTIE